MRTTGFYNRVCRDCAGRVLIAWAALAWRQFRNIQAEIARARHLLREPYGDCDVRLPCVSGKGDVIGGFEEFPCAFSFRAWGLLA
jgi:hypothetical protein